MNPFLEKARALSSSLSLKISLLILFLSLAGSLATGALLYRHGKTILEEEEERRAKNMVLSLADNSTHHFLYEDVVELFKMTRQLVEEDFNRGLVRAAFIQTLTGRVLAHSDPSLFQKLLPLLYPDPEERFSRRRLPDGGFILTTPLETKGATIGYASIEFSPAYKQKKLSLLKRTIFFVSLVLLLVGGGAGVFISRMIFKPLKRLREAVARLGRESLSMEVEVNSRDEVGELARAFRDMTERVRALIGTIRENEAQIYHAEKLSAMGRLTAGLAHEIKNPLTSVRILLETIEEECDGAGSYRLRRDDLALFREEVDRINNVITSFLSFSRPTELTLTQEDINALIRQLASVLKVSARKKGAELSLNLDPSLPPISINRQGIEQVLLNLTMNSLEAVSSGGTVVISTERDEHRHGVILKVKDNGIGIRQEHMSKVFDPFFTTKEMGTGLGLSIVFKVVQEHRGEIKARSGNGSGTEMEVFLPLGEACETPSGHRRR